MTVAQEQRDRVVALYKAQGTIAGVMADIDLPRKVVASIISEMPDREAFRRRGSRPTYSDERMLGDLHKAKEALGEPLARSAYRSIAPKLGLISEFTLINHFGSFVEACRAAGIQSNQALGRRKSSVGPQECLDALKACIRDNDGRWVSIGVYERWAKGKEVPSSGSIRTVVGLWSEAVQEALKQIPEG